MPQHVWVNAGRLKKSRKSLKVDGVNLIVELSPFDIPREIVGEYDRGRRKFVIRFEYTDPELPSATPSVHEGVEVVGGRHSGKLLSISIPVDPPPLDKVGIISLRTRVLKALEGKRGKTKESDDLNMGVAEEILNPANFEHLAEELLT